MKPPSRLVSIPLRLQPLVQVDEACLEVLLVVLLGDPIHSDRRALAHAIERAA